ncbi:hypothetical protein Acsp02_16770 [Actinoplanes sp. NBRC 103695]|nr:hypothetical protein Acsp02_16770 [Actinoplanes sp. NBRC 103695]
MDGAGCEVSGTARSRGRRWVTGVWAELVISSATAGADIGSSGWMRWGGARGRRIATAGFEYISHMRDRFYDAAMRRGENIARWTRSGSEAARTPGACAPEKVDGNARGESLTPLHEPIVTSPVTARQSLSTIWE